LPVIRIGKMMFNFGGTESGRPPNFVPFKSIFFYLFGNQGWMIVGLNIGGNIALLVPVGFLVPLIYKEMNWKKSLVLAVAVGLAFEVTQVVLQVGIFDIDDVILNGLGVMIGYWVFKILAKLMRPKK
jgi:glycopeptide antibiotics resistance protein